MASGKSKGRKANASNATNTTRGSGEGDCQGKGGQEHSDGTSGGQMDSGDEPGYNLPQKTYVYGRFTETGYIPTQALILREASVTTRCGRRGG